MANIIKSTLLFLALTSIATAQVYDTTDAPLDCKSTKSFFSCMHTATAWLTCDHSSDECYCKDYETEEKCLSKYCPDTTETYDHDIFSSCKAIAKSGSATKPSIAEATPTTSPGKSDATKTAGTSTSVAGPTSVAGTTQTGKPNAANAASAPVGGVLGLLGVAIGAFL